VLQCVAVCCSVLQCVAVQIEADTAAKSATVDTVAVCCCIVLLQCVAAVCCIV